MELKMSKKVVPSNYPTNIKRLGTGILDGARAYYISISMEFNGCLVREYVMSAEEFVNSMLVRKQGILIITYTWRMGSQDKELETALLSILDEMIKDVAGTSINKESFQDWKGFNMLLHSAASLRRSKGKVKEEKKHNKKPPNLCNSLRDNKLHHLLFMPKGLPDGAELSYSIRGQKLKLLKGYKQGNCIVCCCCERELSPSRFEVHAGDLLLCHECPQAFHPACLNLEHLPEGEWRCANCAYENRPGRKAVSGEASSMVRPIVIRLTRVVKAPVFEIGGCAICRGYNFNSSTTLDDQTVFLCDQCEKEFHVGCLRDGGLCDLKEIPKGKWFCCDYCNRIYWVLQSSVSNGLQIIPISFSNIIRRKHLEKGLFVDGAVDCVQWHILSGKSHSDEHLPLLSSAAAIFKECFDPIVVEGAHDLIPVMVSGKEITGQDFRGMYCVVLIVRSVVVSAGLLRIFGREIAELPIVATRREHQGKGYFQALFACIERFLGSLNIENLVLPAAEEALSIWTKKFGFTRMNEYKLSTYREQLELMVFEGTSMLEKKVPQISEYSVHLSDISSSE